MATQESMPAQQQASEKNVQEDATGVAEGRQCYFRVQLEHSHSASRIWIAIRADTIGKAFVTADNRTLDTRFRICDGSMTEITKSEYYVLISRTQWVLLIPAPAKAPKAYPAIPASGAVCVITTAMLNRGSFWRK